MIDDMVIRNIPPNTQKAYTHAVNLKPSESRAPLRNLVKNNGLELF